MEFSSAILIGMDSSSGASFIPKSPVKGTVNRRRVRRVYIFTYIIYIFFIGTLIASGVTWFYQYTMERKLEDTKLALNDERSKFNQADLSRVNDVNHRLQEVRRILDRQVSLLSVFKAIEDTTLRSIQLSGFAYQRDLNSELTVNLLAKANDFNATLFQRQVLNGNPVLAQSTLSEVTYTAGVADDPGAGGSVSFTLTTPVSPALTAVTPGVPPNPSSDLIVPTEETEPAPTTNSVNVPADVPATEGIGNEATDSDL